MVEKLKQKVGPLPLFLWILIGGIIVWFLLRRRGSSSSGTEVMPLANDSGGDAFGNTGGTGDSAMGGGGSGSGDVSRSDGSIAPPQTTNTQPTSKTTPNEKPSGIVPQSIAGSIIPKSASVLIDNAKQVAKTWGTPLTTIGNYFSGSGAKPTFVPGQGAAIVTVPGTDKTQGPTSQDMYAESQRQIANSPTLQQQLSQANVTQWQREHALVGPGGILVFGSPESFANAGIRT